MVVTGLTLTCQKLDFDVVTKVKTISIKSGLTTVEAKGELIELSSANHSEYGFCYSTNPEPTINDQLLTLNTAKKGEFTLTVSNLNSNTIYYFRPYCKEGDNFVYGEIVEAKTSKLTFNDIDNNTYNGVEIGTQIWMQENLKVTHYRNGDPIENITDNTMWLNATIGAYCWYNNDPQNKTDYGALYNFYTVIDSRNLCPTGWHVPSDQEWITLTEYLGGYDIAGGKMKEYGLSHWIKPNFDATNTSGFSALPGGYREFDGAFNSFGEEGKWWTSTTADASSSRFRYIYNNYSSLFYDNFPIKSGLSIRCVKD